MLRFKFIAFATSALACLSISAVTMADGWTAGPYVITKKSITPTPNPDTTHIGPGYSSTQPSVWAIVTIDGASATADVTYKRTATYNGSPLPPGIRWGQEAANIQGIANRYMSGSPIATSSATPDVGQQLTNIVTYHSNPSNYNNSAHWNYPVGGDADSSVFATLELLANGVDDEGYATATGAIDFLLPEFAANPGV